MCQSLRVGQDLHAIQGLHVGQDPHVDQKVPKDVIDQAVLYRKDQHLVIECRTPDENQQVRGEVLIHGLVLALDHPIDRLSTIFVLALWAAVVAVGLRHLRPGREADYSSTQRPYILSTVYKVIN